MQEAGSWKHERVRFKREKSSVLLDFSREMRFEKVAERCVCDAGRRHVVCEHDFFCSLSECGEPRYHFGVDTLENKRNHSPPPFKELCLGSGSKAQFWLPLAFFGCGQDRGFCCLQK